MAIAVDASTDGNHTLSSQTHSFNHTCSGSDRYLVVVAFGDVAGVFPDVTATYNSVSMTELGRANTPTDRWMALFGLINPTSGTHAVLVTQNLVGSTATGGSAVSYTGVLQSGQPDSSNSGTGSSTTSFPLSTTVMATGCWLVLGTKSTSGTISGGSGTTARLIATDDLSLLDSNGTVLTGSQTLTANSTASDNFGGVIVSLAPSAQSSYSPAQGPLTMAGLAGQLRYQINMPDEA